ncbi:zinc ribbon domain-containing protein [Natronorubrum sp. JWXQ-INN-674]|uniref:Zinc ribbon domain-containing protein n=1 Tax=Natronorubrum halalkaliphilum TaxID=2691917 RepID=A0A6B0VP15_9EURY|nr:FmdB family zinc ribbon protein [Natronorubrum halalkaliphilum]MXV63561.1 zinc ribbon domain-containing protein [Natronorubrum halalkaliphilum]
MSRYEFTCPECEQAIEVNESMRDATLTHGCPVCGADVTAADFAEQQEQQTN